MNTSKKTFLFIMQHKPTREQLLAARALGADRIVALSPVKPDDKVEGVEYFGEVKLINVPDDLDLSRDWFISQAEQIFSALGGVNPGDIVHAQGQAQLANAINALAGRVEAKRVESVTKRVSVDEPQKDGTVKKTTVFNFAGFRDIYDF